MAGKIEKRLNELGIILPNPASPAANYVPFIVTNNDNSIHMSNISGWFYSMIGISL